MSPVLPSVTAREVTRALERAGFVFRRQRGSHQIYQHLQTGKRVSVPIHRGDFPKGTLRQILADEAVGVSGVGVGDLPPLPRALVALNVSEQLIRLHVLDGDRP
ncbi:MAG: type II toxin-antitoxin system HicA family toxin [Thermoanaerobaculia bacterium]